MGYPNNYIPGDETSVNRCLLEHWVEVNAADDPMTPEQLAQFEVYRASPQYAVDRQKLIAGELV